MMRELTLLGLGAGLMYYLDPDRGRRRRALLRDRLDHRSHAFRSFSRKAGRDARNRALGLASESRAVIHTDEAPDPVIAERIRSAMGRVVSHPKAVEVLVDRGVATLRGPIFDDEVGPLLAVAEMTRGVVEVVDLLEPHPVQTRHPSLQGGKRRDAREAADEAWSPSIRMLAGASGGALLLAGLSRGGLSGLAAGAIGAGLLGRTLADQPARALIGAQDDDHAFVARDSINIDAPVEDVFAFLTNYENYPHILPNVRDVKQVGEGRWRWTLVGPGGVTLRVEDVMTAFEPNRFVSWQGVGGSLLRYSGSARYVERPEGGTTVHGEMAYDPPGGVLGHGLAQFIGHDPRHQLQQILMRTKMFLETGKAPHDAVDPSPPAHHRVRSGS
jgi:uncharacterized membrane protein